MGHLGGALEIVARAGRDLTEHDLFGDAAAQQDRDAVVQVVARVVVLLVHRHLHRQAQRHPARDDRDLVDRVGVRQLHGEHGVTGLVNGGDPLLLVADDHRAPLGAHEHLVLGELEVHHADDLLVVARGVERRFVHQVGQVRTREARGRAGQNGDVHVVAERDLLGVHPENALAALHVRTVDHDAAVETAGTQQRRIEDVRAVGGGDQDDAFVALEAVHLDEQLVQRLLPLVVPAAQAGATVTARRRRSRR